MAEISRRAVVALLGAGAVAAGTQYGLKGAGSPVGPSEAEPGGDNPIRAENRRAGSRDWKIGSGPTVAADDLGRQIKGYASAASVNLGESIDFHVSTHPARPYTVTVYRMGDYSGRGARQVAESPTLPGVTQADPVTAHDTGAITCAWDATWSLTVPREWTSGSYVAAFTTDDGHRSYTPFVVRHDGRPADFLVVLPFSTYQAYNQWPLDGRVGKSLYYGYGTGGDGGGEAEYGSPHADPHGVPISYAARARKVSFSRPYALVGLPLRADLDYDFIQWAERSGYDITYSTSVDLQEGRVDASLYRALISSGHDEYWSRQMRDTVSVAVQNGTHVAFMGANNVYWHVRFEPDPQTPGRERLVCYKTDPDPAADSSGPTRLWRLVAPHGRHAEQSLVGVQYNGIPKTEGPLLVSSADHWIWAGTGVKDGDQIPRIVGGEADGWDTGAPAPVSAHHTLLSASPYTARGARNPQRVQHASLYETASGSIVFAAGTFNWALGLNRPGYADERIQRATANLFNRLRRPAA